jgi:hypothetical protein
MVFHRQIILAIFVSALFFSNSASAKTYNLPIYAFRVTDSFLELTVDDDVLVPSLTGVKLTKANTDPLLPYRGSDESRVLQKSILDQGDFSMGSTALYFYMAVNLALDRIFRNLIFFDRDISKEIPGATSDGATFTNLRSLAQLKPIANARLNVEVYTNREKFDLRSAAIGLHSPRAFWDAENATIGIYFDKAIFRWVRTQTSIAGQSEAELAAHIRDYVNRRVIDTIAHELVHFVQDRSGAKAAKKAFLAELVAVFLQENIFLREERAIIAHAHLQRGLPLRPWLKSCASLWSGIPPWSVETVVRLPESIATARKLGISFEKLFDMDDASFYSQKSEALASEYVLFNPFAAFLTGMEKDEFARRFSAFIDGSGPADVRGIDIAFNEFMKDHEVGVVSEDNRELLTITNGLVTYCLDQRDFISAHSGSLNMVQYAPREVLGIVYMGDVFFNSQNEYFALDYYDLAYRGLKTNDDLSSRVRVISRLADAFQVLGDVDLATSRLKEIENLNPDTLSIDLVLVVLRSKLKLELYTLAKKQGKRPEDIQPMLVEMYAQAFSGWRCATQAEKTNIEPVMGLVEKGDEQSARALLLKQFESVRGEMLRELTQSDWSDVLASRLSNCT